LVIDRDRQVINRTIREFLFRCQFPSLGLRHVAFAPNASPGPARNITRRPACNNCAQPGVQPLRRPG
jgi:hypothetical protein